MAKEGLTVFVCLVWTFLALAGESKGSPRPIEVEISTRSPVSAARNANPCLGRIPYCKNGGMCLEDGNRHRCACPPHFTGPRCETGVYDALDKDGSVMPSSPNAFVRTVQQLYNIIRNQRKQIRWYAENCYLQSTTRPPLRFLNQAAQTPVPQSTDGDVTMGSGALHQDKD